MTARKMRSGRPAWLALAALLGGTGVAAAQGAGSPGCTPAPMLQQGKTQLYERVLTRPGARLAAEEGDEGTTPVPGFSVLYVYKRAPEGNAVQVGARADCKPDGWLPAAAVVPWRHTIVAAFANRTGRERVLFFGSDDPLTALVRAPDAGEQAAKLRAAAVAAGPGSGAAGPIVSIEPENPVDINKQFYLLPILEAKTQRFASGKPTRMLRVAAVTAQDKGAPTPPEPPADADASVRRNFRAAVVFVVDASASMQPYIDRTRQALDRIYAKIEESKLEDRVRFGLIGYRDDPKVVPRLEYLTKVFVDPNEVDSRNAFNEAAKGLNASRVSTRAFAEDGYAGIDAALEGIDWAPFGARFIVLVTDASSRDPDSGLGSTGMDAARLALETQGKGIAIMALHLLTPAGEKTPDGQDDHAKGRKQYATLTQHPGRGALYYPVDSGDVAQFGQTIDHLAGKLVALVQSAEGGAAAQAGQAEPKPADPTLDKLGADIDAIGHAMRLAYLGSMTGSAAPPMFEAWTVDRDLASQATASLEIRVLLSKAQLSDLQATASALIDAWSKSRIDPSDFYNQLRSAAATLSRDPSRIGSRDHQALSQAILGEYLSGLPYTSRVMSIDQDSWRAMSAGEQQAMIDELAVKARLYRRYHDDVARWVTLAKGAAPEDAVYPIPIQALP